MTRVEDNMMALAHETVPAGSRTVLVSGWLRERLPGGIKCSRRQMYFQDNSLIHEEIVLEEIPLTLEENGTERNYPQLRRRK